MKRTEEQRFADTLDCDLYRLIVRAEGRFQPYWQKVARELRKARTQIRMLMTKSDRERTI